MAKIEDLLQRRTDLSTFLVHLTRTSDDGIGALDNLQSIIRAGTIKARKAFGPACKLQSHLAGSSATQKAVCVSETPLEHIWMMLESIDGRAVHFEPYGLAITKTTGRKAGFNPVWYSDITRRGVNWPSTAVNLMVQEALDRATGPDGKVDQYTLQREPVFQLTPYFEQMGPIKQGRKEFWWEREWRKVDDYHLSFPTKVVALFAPEHEHAVLHDFLAQLDADQRTHWVERPILDPRWGLERMVVALARIEAHQIGPFPEAGS
ncbi:abortive infection system antitoxin AbiGi family protein [Kribbella sp. NPDC058245]|uniref:abortive infection system antitoxin AbiGi family protein n=1 Tax=Kribbella sp. NPDC058245 TaxID=3346399 RepID=UPI0036EA719B